MVLKIWNLLRKKGGNVVSIQGEKCYIRTFQEKDAQSLTGLVSRNKYFWSTYEPLQRPEYYTVDAQYKKNSRKPILNGFEKRIYFWYLRARY